MFYFQCDLKCFRCFQNSLHHKVIHKGQLVKMEAFIGVWEEQLTLYIVNKIK